MTKDIDQEKILIERMQAGDHRAVDEIFERYKRPLFGFIVRIINDHDTAEDVFQETFIKMVRYIGKFKGNSKFSTWLFQIALNQSRDTLRKGKNKTFVPIEDHEQTLSVEPMTDPYRIMKSQRVRAIVESLPDKMKETVILRYYHDMDEHEIAEIVGCPAGTVKSRLFRAAGIIRKKWELSEEYTLKEG
ncbi:RNA polymerase sigma factor [Candidatus Latescibacterota bacterium]